jgi:hypothetical protein
MFFRENSPAIIGGPNIAPRTVIERRGGFDAPRRTPFPSSKVSFRAM